MALKFDKNLLPNFDSVKDDDEEILWTDKPKFILYSITGLAAGFGNVIFVSMYFLMARTLGMTMELIIFLFGLLQFLLHFFSGLFCRKFFHIAIRVTE